MITRPPFENFPSAPGYFGHWADFTSAGAADCFTATLIASGTAAVIDTVVGGALRLSGAATTDNSGVNHQLTNAAYGLVLAKEIQYEARVRFGESTSANVVTESDMYAGLSTLDTSIVISNPTNGIYFRKDDGDTNLDCIVRFGSTDVGTAIAAATVAVDTWYVLSIRITCDSVTSGKATITFYLDGTQIASMSLSSLTMAASAMMAPMCCFLTGDGTGTKYLDVDYYGAQQQR